MRRMPRLRRLVAASPALRQLRPCRLLRLVTIAARKPPRRRHRTPRRAELRAGRGLVLGLRRRAVPRRSGPGPAPASPARTARAGTRRPGPPGLAATPALDLPSSGGLAARRAKASDVAELRRRVGVVFQDYKLLPRLPALANVAFGLQVGALRISDAEARDRALDALEAVGLGDRGRAFPHQLSGGQQQRIAIARAVVVQPPLLIADEPTGNLDQETAWEIMDLFEDIAAWGTAVLVATHNVEIVTRLKRRVVTLVDGRLVRDQPAGQTGRMAWLASS